MNTDAVGILQNFIWEFNQNVAYVNSGETVSAKFSSFFNIKTDRSYFSWLMGKKEYVIDARIKGGERHMIMSNEYDRVFPKMCIRDSRHHKRGIHISSRRQPLPRIRADGYFLWLPSRKR